MTRMGSIQPLTQPDVYDAMYGFVRHFGLPALPPDHVYRGWQNRAALPADGNAWAVITIMQTMRRGTNVQTFCTDMATNDDGIVHLAELVTCPVQIDFCAEDDSARQRAQSLELVSRSSLACDYLALGGITPLYAEDVRDLSFVDGSDQFVQRFSLTLHVSFWAVLSAACGWFDRVNTYFENVDVHHPPQLRSGTKGMDPSSKTPQDDKRHGSFGKDPQDDNADTAASRLL